MKKFLMFLMAFTLLLGYTSCNSCSKEKEQSDLVSRTVSLDREYMCANFSCDYVYYETQIKLAEYVDEEDCTGAVVGITNIFQTVEGGDSAYTPHVYTFKHTGDTLIISIVQDFWIEDCDMAKDKITITYSQAYENLMKADCIKPHSNDCVLRKMVGPYECNPQYIFGGAFDECIFVDAITGNVSLENPAFTPRE